MMWENESCNVLSAYIQNLQFRATGAGTGKAASCSSGPLVLERLPTTVSTLPLLLCGPADDMVSIAMEGSLTARSSLKRNEKAERECLEKTSPCFKETRLQYYESK